MRPSVVSVLQILTSAVCMGPAVRPVATLKAPTPVHVWRATCRSPTTAHARPRMVSQPTSVGLHVIQSGPRLRVCSVPVPPVDCSLCSCHVPVPVDRLPVLLIANSQNIQATSLSGTAVHSLLSTSTKQTTAMDFLYAEETVCWIHVGEAPSSTHLKCAKIPNLKSFTEERVINISLSLHREYTAARYSTCIVHIPGFFWDHIMYKVIFFIGICGKAVRKRFI